MSSISLSLDTIQSLLPQLQSVITSSTPTHPISDLILPLIPASSSPSSQPDHSFQSTFQDLSSQLISLVQQSSDQDDVAASLHSLNLLMIWERNCKTEEHSFPITDACFKLISQEQSEISLLGSFTPWKIVNSTVERIKNNSKKPSKGVKHEFTNDLILQTIVFIWQGMLEHNSYTEKETVSMLLQWIGSSFLSSRWKIRAATVGCLATLIHKHSQFMETTDIISSTNRVVACCHSGEDHLPLPRVCIWSLKRIWMASQECQITPSLVLEPIAGLLLALSITDNYPKANNWYAEIIHSGMVDIDSILTRTTNGLLSLLDMMNTEENAGASWDSATLPSFKTLHGLVLNHPENFQSPSWISSILSLVCGLHVIAKENSEAKNQSSASPDDFITIPSPVLDFMVFLAQSSHPLRIWHAIIQHSSDTSSSPFKQQSFLFLMFKILDSISDAIVPHSSLSGSESHEIAQTTIDLIEIPLDLFGQPTDFMNKEEKQSFRDEQLAWKSRQLWNLRIIQHLYRIQCPPVVFNDINSSHASQWSLNCLSFHDANRSWSSNHLSVESLQVLRCVTLQTMGQSKHVADLIQKQSQSIIELISLAFQGQEQGSERDIGASRLAWTVAQITTAKKLTNVIDVVVTITLMLLDDHRERRQVVALSIVNHMLDVLTPTEFRWHGEAIIRSLLSCIHTKDVKLLSLILPCLIRCVSTHERSNDGKSYDALMDDLCQQFFFVHKKPTRLVYLENLAVLVDQLGIHFLKHSKHVLAFVYDVMDLHDPQMSAICLDILSSFINNCPQRMDAHLAELYSVLSNEFLFYAILMKDDAHRESITTQVTQICKQLMDTVVNKADIQEIKTQSCQDIPELEQLWKLIE